jgi:hypothetical protein
MAIARKDLQHATEQFLATREARYTDEWSGTPREMTAAVMYEFDAFLFEEQTENEARSTQGLELQKEFGR